MLNERSKSFFTPYSVIRFLYLAPLFQFELPAEPKEAVEIETSSFIEERRGDLKATFKYIEFDDHSDDVDLEDASDLETLVDSEALESNLRSECRNIYVQHSIDDLLASFDFNSRANDVMNRVADGCVFLGQDQGYRFFDAPAPFDHCSGIYTKFIK